MTNEEAEATGLWVDIGNRLDMYAARRVKKETNDCSVRSFSVVWDVPYDKAHEHIKKFGGRKHRGGLANSMFETADKWCPKTLMKKGPYTEQNRITIKKFCELHPVGRYWLGVAGHCLAVIDGVVHDHRYGPRRFVTCAWRVYGPKEEFSETRTL